MHTYSYEHNNHQHNHDHKHEPKQAIKTLQKRFGAKFALPTLGMLSLLSFLSSAQAICNCTLSANNVNFGVYKAKSNANTDTTNTIKLTCQAVPPEGCTDMPYTITLNKGSSTTYAPRSMHAGSKTLPYNLFISSDRTMVFGDNTEGTNVISDKMTCLTGTCAKDFTVYERLLGASNSIAAGAYTDSITATLHTDP